MPLLEHKGTRAGGGRNRMVDLLLSLQAAHARRVYELLSDTLSGPRLRNLLHELGLSDGQGGGASAGDMLLAGFHPRTEPHLRKKVGAVVRHALERIASGRFPVPMALALMGVPDWTGTVQAGEVVIIEEGKFFEEDVLLYRNPGTHVGDVRKVRAVLPTPQLLAMVGGVHPDLMNGIFFSIRGERQSHTHCPQIPVRAFRAPCATLTPPCMSSVRQASAPSPTCSRAATTTATSSSCSSRRPSSTRATAGRR